MNRREFIRQSAVIGAFSVIGVSNLFGNTPENMDGIVLAQIISLRNRG
jgi:hypothetical protein